MKMHPLGYFIHVRAPLASLLASLLIIAGVCAFHVVAESKPSPKKPTSTPLPHWTRLIMAVDPGSQGDAWTKTSFNHSKWKTMKIPGHFDTAQLPNFDGVVWFRKTIELSPEQAKSKAILHLGQIDDMDVTWVNGTRIGGYETPGHHYTVRNYPVPAGLLKTGKNTIAVRVMDHGAPGGIAGNPEQLFLELGKETVPLANLWHYAPGANLNALNKQAEIHIFLRPLTRPAKPVPAFAKGFKITDDQTIILLGGANAAESSRYGWIETLISTKHPKHQLSFRNMAWPADTVYQQQRPRNFFSTSKPSYGEADHRPTIAADTIFLWFGKMESLETGNEKSPSSFRTSYEAILNQLDDYTGRVVLITPAPFEDPLGIGLDSEELNINLAEYVATIRELADDRGLPVVDLFTELKGKPVTSDGQMLSTEGHRLAAEVIARQLGFSSQLSTGNETLRGAFITKNALWRQYWLPTNWAFLYGNRQTTPSSRSHIRGKPRWFPEDVNKSLSDLEQMEKKIWKELPKKETD